MTCNDELFKASLHFPSASCSGWIVFFFQKKLSTATLTLSFISNQQMKSWQVIYIFIFWVEIIDLTLKNWLFIPSLNIIR